MADNRDSREQEADEIIKRLSLTNQELAELNVQERIEKMYKEMHAKFQEVLNSKDPK